MKYYLTGIVLYFHILSGIAISEIFYPVGIVPDGSHDKVLCIYHNNVGRRQVFLCDIRHHTNEPCLSTFYNPANVQLLPDGTGFSFIDNGILKIKEFNKRSARIVEIYEPLHNLTCFQWTPDGQYCLLQAKRTDKYGIYIVDREGEIKKIATCNDAHCICPQIRGDVLFYVRINCNGHHHMCTKNLITQHDQILFTIQDQIQHIMMADAFHGCFISYTDNENKRSINFFWFESDEWRVQEMTKEDAPFFDDNACLCEIKSFLRPAFENGRIYLPILQRFFSGELSYVDIENHRILTENFSHFFNEGQMVRHQQPGSSKYPLVFFGSPLIVCRACFIGMAW